MALPGFAVVLFFLLLLFVNMVKILREYDRGVIFRLGRLTGVRGPGQSC